MLRLIRRRDGSVLPGLQASPSCEIAFPASNGAYYLMQVLLDGELVRVFPRGREEHGLVYPVDDPYAFCKLLGHLAAA